MARTLWIPFLGDGTTQTGFFIWSPVRGHPNNEPKIEQFDAGFYQLMPRGGLYAASRWDAEINHNAAYPALGSPNWVIQLKPNIGTRIAVAFEMFVEASGTGKIKFYIKSGANRDQLTWFDDTQSVLSEFTTTTTRAGSTRVPKRAGSTLLSGLVNCGNVEGEDVELEIYLEHTTNTVVIRNMRIYAGMSYLVEKTSGVDGDFLI
jgi:hypothetical protein